MTVEFFCLFSISLCFIAGVVDGVRVTMKDVSRWDGGGYGEEG